jgi:hypothetical protein
MIGLQSVPVVFVAEKMGGMTLLQYANYRINSYLLSGLSYSFTMSGAAEAAPAAGPVVLPMVYSFIAVQGGLAVGTGISAGIMCLLDYSNEYCSKRGYTWEPESL